MTETNKINDMLDYMPETFDISSNDPSNDPIIESLDELLIDNPFINTQCVMTQWDSKLETYVNINQSNIKHYYDTIFLLVKKTAALVPIEFYNLKVPLHIIKQVSSNLILYKTSIKILNNKTHFDSIVMLSDDQLKEYNIFNYILATKNIIIPIFNITYNNLIKYHEQYYSTNTLRHIYKVKLLNQYFKIEESNYNSNKFINQMISNLEESEYWSNPLNCKATWTTEFKNRSFTFQTNRITDKTISQIIIKILNDKTTKAINGENYMQSKNSNKKNYTDIASTINKHQRNQFIKDRNNCVFSKNDINELFDVLNKQQKFLLFTNLLISKKYAHLVINNEVILDLMKADIVKYKSLFRYLLSYTWIQLYMEECLQNSFTKTTDNHIFDINTASKLPIFPFIYEAPTLNPYMPILVAMYDLKPFNNIGGIPNYNTPNDTLKPQGIVSLEEFKWRFNIFCTSNSENNLFENIDFEKYNIGITGSVITACIQKAHPLMSRFNAVTIQEKFNNYFNEYYAVSDIDIMMKTKCMFEFIDNVTKIYHQIVANISKFSGLEKPPVELCLNKISYLFVSEDFIKENIYNLINDDISDKLNYIKEHIEEQHIKDLFKPHFLSEQLKYLSRMPKPTYNSLDYPEIFNKEHDFRIYINNNNNQNKYLKKIDMEVTYKYKITSPHLNHALEIFPIKNNDFMGVVSGFHLPCVRGYYNDSNVFLTPSCISAHLTFMNIDYKYMVCGKDPIEIINKNRMRGFGTWLNKQEKTMAYKYSEQVPFWNSLYNLAGLSKGQGLSDYGGFFNLNRNLFHPRLCNIDLYTDMGAPYVNLEFRYCNDLLPKKLKLNDITDLSFITDTSHTPIIKNFDWLQLTAINNTGNIVPLKKWVIDLICSLYE